MSGQQDQRWTLIIPCAAPLRPGSRLRPKWLLTTPGGQLLVTRAAATVPRERIGRRIVVVLQECEERYGVTEALRRAFDGDVECLVLDQPTGGPAETVRRVIEQARVTGPICIKDGDSFFTLRGDFPDSSFIAVADLRAMPSVSEPGRKSYVRLNEQDMIADVVEKNVVSNLISIGLYGFIDAAVFVAAYERLAGLGSGRNLFVSHVVANAVLHRHVFVPCAVNDIVDIGTRADWNAYRERLPTIVLDIDGVIFRNQSLFFPPYWGDPPEPIQENVDHILSLQGRGAQLVFMTSRPERFRAATLSALEGLGLRVHALIMDCQHGTRFLVNDYAQSNPFPSAVAVNVRRNSTDLQHVLLEDHRTLDREL